MNYKLFGSRLYLFVIMTFSYLIFSASLAFSAPSYQLIDLGAPPDSDSWGMSINNSGKVAGGFYTSGTENHGALFSGGSIIDFGPGEARGINDYGQVTGQVNLNAFVYNSGVITEFGRGCGYGINNSGQVTGELVFPGYSGPHVFLYSAGSISDLGTLGGPNGWGYDINDSGQIVGASDLPTSSTPGAQVTHAFLYSGGEMKDLGTLTGNLLSYSYARAINDSGLIVGNSEAPSGLFTADHAFLYSNNIMTDLGTLPGDRSSQAWDINNLGQIVGYSGNRAFIFIDGVMYDLNELVDITNKAGFTNLHIASAINDNGQITGSGSTADGSHHAFLAIPVARPKPVSIDIEPWFKPNIINLKFKWAPIPVAILSTPDFDASKMIDRASLTFGDSGDENSLSFCSPISINVNKDKFRDLICFFYTGKTGFYCGDIQGTLKGKTKDGTPIEGSDTVKIVPCK